MKMKIQKGKIARCPYCGRTINYFFLYESKHYDFGHCSHCGGIYAVRYSGWTAVMICCALVATACGVLLQFLADRSMPSWKFFFLMAAVLMVIYLLIPVFILPTKCVIDGRLGGFQNQEAMPDNLQQKIENSEEEQEKTPVKPGELSDKAKKMFVAFYPEQDDAPAQKPDAPKKREKDRTAQTEEPTIVASDMNGNPLSAEERCRRARNNRNHARHVK